jgi:hypothetical protein
MAGFSARVKKFISSPKHPTHSMATMGSFARQKADEA